MLPRVRYRVLRPTLVSPTLWAPPENARTVVMDSVPACRVTTDSSGIARTTVTTTVAAAEWGTRGPHGAVAWGTGA